MPGLGDAGVHQRVAPLAEVIEELVRFADHFAEVAALVHMRDQLFQDDAVNAHAFLFAPCARTNHAPRSRPGSTRPRPPSSRRERRTPSTLARGTSC